MGLISTAAFVLATQTAPHEYHYTGAGGDDTNSADSTEPIVATKIPQVSRDRVSEIWDHVDNRISNQSDIWFKDGQFPQCISLLRVQYAYSPNDYDTMTNLGWMLENVSEMDQARGIYIEFIGRFPNNGGVVFALGNSYYTKQDWINTIKITEPSLAKNATPNSFIIVAKSYERQGKFADALRIWELELKNFPGMATAIANINRVKAKIAAGGK